jgi:hypothetical protein
VIVDPTLLRYAHSIDVNVCRDGYVHVWFIDEEGTHFAVASFKPHEVPHFQELVEAARQRALAAGGAAPSDTIGPCEGRA